MNRITTQAELAPFIGKRLVLNSEEYAIFTADGRIQGEFNGQELRGTYLMRDGYFCRTITQGPAGPSGENCQTIEHGGNRLTFRRDRGQGDPFTYTVS